MSHVRASALVTMWAALTTCSAEGGPAGDGEPTGSATAAVTVGGTDILCITVEVAGDKVVVSRAFDVASETSTVFDLNGLPLGKDIFSAAAYPVACSSVSHTTAPAFVSNAVVADVEPANAPVVELDLLPQPSNR